MQPATLRAEMVIPAGLEKIEHIIVIYQENWSFDALYGHFPGAEGINQADNFIQRHADNSPYQHNPPVLIKRAGLSMNDHRIPVNLPVAPFQLHDYIPAGDKTGDLVHRFYTEQQQINNGNMDHFMLWSDNPGLVMSGFDATNMPEGKLAQQYVLADHFFHAAFGGSFLNHMFLIAARPPRFSDAPAAMRAKLDGNGMPLLDAGPGHAASGDNAVTPDGYAVNTVYPANAPHPLLSNPSHRLPPQTHTTIGDRLSDKGIAWAWYAGGWDQADRGNPPHLFQFHHQPFVYFARYAEGTTGRAEHLKDEQAFLTDLQHDRLPAVAFIKPLGADNEHPGYAALQQGQQHVADLVAAIQQSPHWRHSAIIIAYDEHGGRWDHVAPPVVDRWGPGTRVPTIIISPYAKRHFVDHTVYDTTSILRFIESRWQLEPLTSRDAGANNLLNAFDFNRITNLTETVHSAVSAGYRQE